jgi:hypothetical protein
MPDEPFLQFLNLVRQRFWKLVPVEPELDRETNTVERVATLLIADLSDREVLGLAEHALRYPSEPPALVSARFVAEAASGEFPPDLVRKVIVDVTERVLRHGNVRIRQEDNLRREARQY